MIRFEFDKEKGIASLLYVVHRLIDSKCTPDFHKIFKIFYFADKKHITKYGRPIVGDYYVAMKNGPVPSHIYDILKAAKGCGDWFVEEVPEPSFEVQGHLVHPLLPPDMEEMSESEIECLNESILENKHKSFSRLSNESHDEAYNNADLNNRMSFRDIAKAAGASPSIIEYMAEISENRGVFNGHQSRCILSP